VTVTRVQLDLQHFPEGIILKLTGLAKEKGLTLGVYCRMMLIEIALKAEKKS
jgi:hypothetical protein